MVSVLGVKRSACCCLKGAKAVQNHMPFIANSTTVASQTNPASPVYMASTSQTASSNWQAMTAQPALRIETLVMSNESYVFPHGRNFVANSLVYPVNP